MESDDQERLVNEVLKEVENLDISADSTADPTKTPGGSKPAADGEGVFPPEKVKTKKVTFQKKEKTAEEKVERKEKLMKDWRDGNRVNAICFLNQMTAALRFQDMIDAEATPPSNETDDDSSRSIVRLEYDGKIFQGTGNSRKLAKQSAATAAMYYIDSHPNDSQQKSTDNMTIYCMNDAGQLTQFVNRSTFVARLPGEHKPTRHPRFKPSYFSGPGPQFLVSPHILSRANGAPMVKPPATAPNPTALEQTAELFKNPTAILNYLLPGSRYVVKLMEPSVRQVVENNGEGEELAEQGERAAASAAEANKETEKGDTGVKKEEKKKNLTESGSAAQDTIQGDEVSKSEQERGGEKLGEEGAKKKPRKSFIVTPGRCVLVLHLSNGGQTFEATAAGKKKARAKAAAMALEKLYNIHCEEDEDGMMRFHGTERDWKHLKPAANFKYGQVRTPQVRYKAPLLSGPPNVNIQKPQQPAQQHPVCILCEIYPGAKFSYDVVSDAPPHSDQDAAKSKKPDSKGGPEPNEDQQQPTSLFSGAAAAAAAAAANQPPVTMHVAYVEVEGLKFEGKGATKAAAKKLAAESALVGIQSVTSLADRLRKREHKRQLAAARKRGGVAGGGGYSNFVRRAVTLNAQDYEYGYRRSMGGYPIQQMSNAGGYGKSRGTGLGRGGYIGMDGEMMNNGYPGGDWGGMQGAGRGMQSYPPRGGSNMMMGNKPMSGGYMYPQEGMTGESAGGNMGSGYSETYGRRIGGMGYAGDGGNGLGRGSGGVVRRAGRGRNWQSRASGEPYPVGLVGSGSTSGGIATYSPGGLSQMGSERPSPGRNHSGSAGQFTGLGGGYATDSSLQMGVGNVSASTGGARVGVGAQGGAPMMVPHHSGEAAHPSYYQPAPQQPPQSQQMISGWRGGTFPPHYSPY